MLLDLLVSSASADLLVPRDGAERALVQALLAEGLIELRRGAYCATAAGLRAIEDRGRTPGLSGSVAVLFTDVVASTRLIERLGDDGGHRVIRRHFELLRVAITTHSGHEVKCLGDGLMVVFGAASDAVACAAAMQAAVDREGDGLGLRIGIHAGEPVREGNDYFGTPVIIARRLCDSAGAGQTLVSELVEKLVAEREFESLGGLDMKGLRDPVRASALAGWRSRNAEPASAAVVGG